MDSTKLTRLLETRSPSEVLPHVATALAQAALAGEAAAIQALRATLRAQRFEDAADQSYARGLIDLAAALMNELASAQRDEALVAAMERSAWKAILEALANGARFPGELAVALDRHESSVSRTLAELRTAGLVEQYAFDVGDKRRKPHRLTPRARRLMRRSGRPRAVIEEDAAARLDEARAALDTVMAVATEAKEALDGEPRVPAAKTSEAQDVAREGA